MSRLFMHHAALAAMAICGVCALPVCAQVAEVTVDDDGATITLDGAPFASYLLRSGHQPVIWPIVGPDGQAMTRQYPLGEKLATEKDDHPHHRSLWFNHGSVNGLDFWMEPDEEDDNQIKHREFRRTGSSDGAAEIVAVNDWLSNGKKICEDERTIKFGADKNGRWIDFTVVVTASEGELVFGDTKEGAFGMRVPGEIDVDAKRGGAIRNSNGKQNEEAWGAAAEWVDYHGVIDGKPAGIVIFDLPNSFRHPTRWHVRTYGLFAANPFGEHDFPPGGPHQGEVKLAKGEQLRLHYRVLFYAGERTPDELAATYREYAGK
ncbi:DUF6807 domain-containing protein [Lacipirellula limnantheis]|uniref:Methane oxygenase PmoA n=1 Tax=Lacipirellula limnantheis TaxID=2528024 RepID=A0A517TUL3_9BACT|nr:PmoA family protein [Lacipirellula limnantheis]QDT72061.1 hypothetical protein I41_12270 [Lacipirellula limnantheis]